MCRWLWRRPHRLAIGLGCVVLMSVAYYFVVQPLITLRTEAGTIGQLTASMQKDWRQKKLGRLESQWRPLLAALMAARASLARLQYLAWMPTWGPELVSGSRLVDAAYWMTMGMRTALPAFNALALGFGDQRGRDAPDLGVNTDVTASLILKTGPSLLEALPPFYRASQDLCQVNPDLMAGFLPTESRWLKQLLPTVRKWRPLLGTLVHHRKAVAAMLGIDRPARYLMIFQDSGELRATGGFMAADGYLNINRTTITASVQNITQLDHAVRTHKPAPWVLQHYFGARHVAFFNANLSPDLPVTGRVLNQLYRSIRHAPPINGLIFVDTWLAAALIRDVGPITLPPVDGSITLDGQNAYYDMEYLAERLNRPNATRKLFLNPILAALETRCLHARGSVLEKVLHTIAQALADKHLLFYFNSKPLENVALGLNWADAVRGSPHQNFLEVVNENFGGHKDNYFLQQALTVGLEKVNGRYRQTVTVMWTMPAVEDGWLVVPYPGWIRLYVPEGSTLIALSGSGTTTSRVYTNVSLHKTVIAANVVVPDQTSSTGPPGSGTLRCTYELPSSLAHPHRLLLEIQAGLSGQQVSILGPGHQPFTQRSDQRIHL